MNPQLLCLEVDRARQDPLPPRIRQDLRPRLVEQPHQDHPHTDRQPHPDETLLHRH